MSKVTQQYLYLYEEHNFIFLTFALDCVYVCLPRMSLFPLTKSGSVFSSKLLFS